MAKDQKKPTPEEMAQAQLARENEAIQALLRDHPNLTRDQVLKLKEKVGF